MNKCLFVNSVCWSKYGIAVIYTATVKVIMYNQHWNMSSAYENQIFFKSFVMFLHSTLLHKILLMLYQAYFLNTPISSAFYELSLQLTSLHTFPCFLYAETHIGKHRKNSSSCVEPRPFHSSFPGLFPSFWRWSHPKSSHFVTVTCHPTSFPSVNIWIGFWDFWWPLRFVVVPSTVGAQRLLLVVQAVPVKTWVHLQSIAAAFTGSPLTSLLPLNLIVSLNSFSCLILIEQILESDLE